MNSKQSDFDWHRHGIWLMFDPKGAPILDTVGLTPYSCRAKACRDVVNCLWSVMHERGFYVQELQAMPELELRVQEQVTASESHWRYPATGRPEDQPPKGVGLLLLTEGKVSVTGDWTDNGGFIAWAPKIRRDKALEEKLGLL